jgi:hypothetical protein
LLSRNEFRVLWLRRELIEANLEERTLLGEEAR